MATSTNSEDVLSGTLSHETDQNVACGNGHANHQINRYCETCGIQLLLSTDPVSFPMYLDPVEDTHPVGALALALARTPDDLETTRN
jgi:hypothetical protein